LGGEAGHALAGQSLSPEEGQGGIGPEQQPNAKKFHRATETVELESQQ
jgi:hypothetical protein